MTPDAAAWVQKAEDDIGSARQLATQLPRYKDQVCFHCQQAAEKYLKALLQELGAPVPRTHDLDTLLQLILPHDATLRRLRRGLRTLTRYAAEYRYPFERATGRQTHSALRIAGQVRTELRLRLKLSS
jgi:HEPN domain-containing protein